MPGDAADAPSPGAAARAECLKTAERILLGGGRDEQEQEHEHEHEQTKDPEKERDRLDAIPGPDRLAKLCDDLRDVLSASAREEEACPVRSVLWGAPAAEGTAATAKASRDVLATEADLYRALWLACLVLRSSIGPEANPGLRRGLETTVERCRFLVGILEGALGPKGSPATLAQDNSGGSSGGSAWDDRIREWTRRTSGNRGEAENTNTNTNTNDDDDDDDTYGEDGSPTPLVFTREQLEQEERELLAMASTPIPPEASFAGGPSAKKRRTEARTPFRTEELARLWPADEVEAAHAGARRLAAGERPGGA